MDSFLSLFDPSDSQTRTSNKKRHKPEQDNVKKKVEAPSKGRKRGRRSQVKNETLPEESSFLCEPDLSNEVLVKDGSYIESYFEVNRAEEETLDEDTRPKRRNSRKGRRRKNKVSPAKDLTPNFGWDDESDSVDSQGASLNNHFFKPKVADDQIGKNVNNLKNEDRQRHRPKIGSFEEREVYNVIDKLEKVSLKDDVYLAGDFDAEDMENDFIYNSDEVEESFDDTASDASDSEEAYGSLPPEPRFGNVEYKLQLVAPCERRFQHLVTQLKWRLRSGGGCAVYVVGVRDCGALRGLRPRALRATLRTLAKMAAALAATVNHCSVRRVAPHRAVAEIYIRKLADAQQSVELRVAVMGANEAGKSTLIGVLTQGELDNGRGSARLNMFRHLHEVKSGRTSSLSHEILGFDAQGNVVNYGCSELMTAERIGERSARLVSFLDLAGHSKYQRTTVHGLTGYCPHYAMLVISATAGITPITEEHLGLVLALGLPLFVAITKAELSAAAVPPLVERLRVLLAPAGKKPLLISDEQSARSCVAPQPLILDAIDCGAPGGGETHDPHSSVAVFPVSCVRGGGLRALHAGLLALSVPVQPPSPDGAGARTDEDADADDADGDADEERCEFQIDEIFHVGDGGPVVGGLMVRGQLREGDHVVVGPLENGDFIPIVVKSIHRNRVPHGSVRAGQSASLGLCGASRPRLRPGQAVLAAPGARVGPRPVFAACGKHRHTAEFANIVQGGQHHDYAKNRKNVRRKNKNLLQDLAKVESSLIKNNEIQPANFYKSDSESDKKETENMTTRRKDSDGDIANELDNSGLDSENNLRYKNRKNSAKDSRVYDDSIEDTGVINIDTKLNNTTKDATKYNTKDENLIVKKTNVNFEEKWSTIDKRKETQDTNVYKSESDGDIVEKEDDNDVECTCHEMVPLEDPNDPRGCLYFQATMHVLRHPTAIKPGFQCTVHAGNVRQTAIIEGILSGSGAVLAGAAAAALFRFARCPEYLAPGRRLLLTAGLGTRAIGRVTQVFPYFP